MNNLSRNHTRNITVVGSGYVGMSASILLAQHNPVTVFDIDKSRVDKINSFISPIQDDYIEKYLKEAEEGSRDLSIKATLNPEEAYRNADFIIIATPTDYNPDIDYFDCSSVESVIEEILEAEKITHPAIVIKSTVPFGYTQSLKKKYCEDNIIFAPEFLRESKALYDSLHPSRIILGCDGETRNTAEEFAALIKECIINKSSEVVYMGYSEAEAVKLFSNTYLAMRVSFFNELDTFSEVNGLNSTDVIRGICLDPRIGDYYNNPSFGYGGYCLPKDTKQMLANFRNIPEDLIKAVVDSNSTRKSFIAERIMKIAENTLKERKDNDRKAVIGIFRLIMKTGSDNFRQSAIRGVMKRLSEKNVDIIIYEPALEDGSVLDGFRVVNNLSEFKNASDCIVANRYSTDLNDVINKVYTRDIFRRD